jgi:glycosyltransferase involved in cell wall biosynthesis
MPDNNNNIILAHELKCCVIIPTYNNANSLRAVMEDVSQYVEDVIIVNDGSTDKTTDILKSIKSATVISYQPNRGKGYALKQGFKRALALGFRYAITIDSDGQHYGSDIAVFLDKIQQCPDCLIVGSRLLKQENMSGGSAFANNFSNFWYRLQTGINLPDTQSGFRLYPLNKMAGKHFFTSRYEAELEMLVRAAWSGIIVCDVAISVYYPPLEDRVSHFRPFQDFFRISILNTFLTIIAFVYAYPKKWILRLFNNS